MSILRTIVMTTACLGAGGALMAQSVPDVKLAPSPAGQAAIQVSGTWTKTDNGPRYEGGKWMVVDYSRPLLRGRKDIFGSGATYGEAVRDGSPIWRAGANATTTLTTQTPIIVGGKTLGPGVYNVFVDLKAGEWTLILNNQARQPKYDPNDKVNLYGSYNHDAKFDVARVRMTVDVASASTPPVEQFTIGFRPVNASSVLLRMEWEHTVATAPIEIGK